MSDVCVCVCVLQDGVTSDHGAALEQRQQEEERVRSRLAALSSRLQELNREAVALVSGKAACSTVHVCMYVWHSHMHCVQTKLRDRDSRSCHLARVSSEPPHLVLLHTP